MLEIIYGKRGSGKTKRLVAMANENVKTCAGDIVYIDDDNRCILDLNHEIRFMNAQEYDEVSPCLFIGFMYGVLASDYDIKRVYVDGLPKLVGFSSPVELEELVGRMKKIADKFNITITISISGPKNEEPDFIKDYII